MLLKKDEKSFEILSEGQHLLICYLIADLGDIPESYQGQTPKPTRKILFGFEAPGTQITIEAVPERLRHSEEFTASLNSSANLRKALIGWKGANFTQAEDEEGFDPFSMLGKAVIGTIIHKKALSSGKERAEVAAWAPVPEGTEIPEAPENKLIKFSWDHFNRDTLLALPDWIQKKIQESSQYKAGINVQMAAQDAGNAAEHPGANQEPLIEIPAPISGPADNEELPF